MFVIQNIVLSNELVTLRNKIKSLEVENKDTISRLESSEKINRQLVLELENQLKVNQSLHILKEE